MSKELDDYLVLEREVAIRLARGKSEEDLLALMDAAWRRLSPREREGLNERGVPEETAA